nr:transcription elongation factor A protein 2 isoform X3 [Meriones unguiculatus]XP_021503226.1 transcription elongation factor A protein 2 isoform X3 [Meriones unguiculatus]
MDLLRELKAMPVTLHLLQSTRVGMSVNALRKQSSDEELIALAKSLIKSWKKLLGADVSNGKSRDQGRGASLPTSSSKDASGTTDLSCKKPDPPRTSSTPRITTFPQVPITCDAVRNKCREMLTLALQTDHDHVAVGVDCEHLSAQIEECIFLDVGNTDMKYKNRVRSRISNLKDAKNPGLRQNVLCGAITPQQIAVMTSEEMASDELKEIRKAMTKEAIREHQMARTGGTQTDLFTCSKCRKKNCTYTQVGVRAILLVWDLRAQSSPSWMSPMSLLLVWGSVPRPGGLALPSMEGQECNMSFGCGIFRPCQTSLEVEAEVLWETISRDIGKKRVNDDGLSREQLQGLCKLPPSAIGCRGPGLRGRAGQSPLPTRTGHWFALGCPRWPGPRGLSSRLIFSLI